MGIISDLVDAILDSGSSSADVYHDTKTTVDDEGSVRVREAAYITDKDTGSHSTVWSTTEVDGKTGEATIKEGGHGENYHPK
jgi:hypothetical protein